MRLLLEDKFEYPVKGKISSGYGKRTINGKTQNHLGIDISVSPNSKIESPLDGVVISSRDGAGKCGGMIEILHDLGEKKITTLYCHLNGREVSKGEEVKKGDIIGYTGGNTDAPYSKKGNSMGSHLHFGISEVIGNAKKKVDPMKYLEKDLETGLDLDTPELKKKLEKIGDLEVGGEKLSDILKSGKEKISTFTKPIIDKILDFIGITEEEYQKQILEQRIIKRLKNEKTLK